MLKTTQFVALSDDMVGGITCGHIKLAAISSVVSFLGVGKGNLLRKSSSTVTEKFLHPQLNDHEFLIDKF